MMELNSQQKSQKELIAFAKSQVPTHFTLKKKKEGKLFDEVKKKKKGV